MNKAIIQGRVGKQPELRTFQNGDTIATFSVATNEGYYDAEKNWIDRTEWHNVVVRDFAAKKVSELPAGTEVLVEGKIRTREYEKPNGEKARTTEILAKSVKAFGLKKQDTPQNQAADAHEQGCDSFHNIPDTDDLPF